MQGKRHLGAAIGSREYTEQFVGDKVKAWTQEVLLLAEIAPSQPHAAYAAFVHGLSSHWTYLSRTIPEVSDLFQPLEDAIHQVFIPFLTGCPPCSKLTRDLLALPVRLGGLGLTNPTVTSDDNFQASVKLTAPLVAVIATQDQTLEIDPNDIFAAKTEIRASNRQHSEDRANVIHSQLTPELKRCVDLERSVGLPPGSPCYLSQSKASICTRESSGMPYVCAMGGPSQTLLGSTTAVKPSPSIMLWYVTWWLFIDM